jgi:hypothetical protein
MGGSNSSENLIELTVEEHAEAHRILFEKHGHWQDFMAWKALSGQITKDDLRKELCRLANQGKKLSEEHKQKIKLKQSGRKFSEEHKNNISKSLKGRKITWDLKANTTELKKRKSEKMKSISKPKIVCPNCGKVGGLPQMKQWHFDNCKGKK